MILECFDVSMHVHTVSSSQTKARNGYLMLHDAALLQVIALSR